MEGWHWLVRDNQRLAYCLCTRSSFSVYNHNPYVYNLISDVSSVSTIFHYGLYIYIDFHYKVSNSSAPPNKSHSFLLSHRYSPQSFLIRMQSYKHRASACRSPVLTAANIFKNDILQMKWQLFCLLTQSGKIEMWEPLPIMPITGTFIPLCWSALFENGQICDVIVNHSQQDDCLCEPRDLVSDFRYGKMNPFKLRVMHHMYFSQNQNIIKSFFEPVCALV